MRAAFALLCVCVIFAAPAAAQELFPADFARGELGAVEIGGSLAGPDSLWFRARVGRAPGESGTFALDIGLAGSSADGGYFTVTGGLELRAFARRRVSPFFRLEAGYVNESGGDCIVGWGGGLSVRVSGPATLRSGVSLGAHCIFSEHPAVASLGAEYRW